MPERDATARHTTAVIGAGSVGLLSATSGPGAVEDGTAGAAWSGVAAHQAPT